MTVGSYSEAFIEGFPNNPNKIRGLPTFESLKVLKQDLQINAASVPCNLGGGAHGYLGAILDAATYAIIAGNDAAGAAQPFVQPTFPGMLPVVVGGTVAVREDEMRVFNARTHAWREYDNITKALRKLIINTIDDVYLSPIKNPITGYNAVSLQDMLAHLFTSYGQIQPHDEAANEARLMEPWGGSEPFETIIACIDDCIAFAAAANQLYSEAQILSKSITGASVSRPSPSSIAVNRNFL